MKPSPLLPPSADTPRRVVVLRTLWLPDFDIPPQAPEPEWTGSADGL